MTARALVLLLITAGLTALAACDDPVPRTVTETYDDSCSVDSDCEVVSYANCGPCGSCGDLVINRAELARFNEDNQISCFDPFPSPVACDACAPVVGTCVSGTCERVFCGDAEDGGPCAF